MQNKILTKRRNQMKKTFLHTISQVGASNLQGRGRRVFALSTMTVLFTGIIALPNGNQLFCVLVNPLEEVSTDYELVALRHSKERRQLIKVVNPMTGLSCPQRERCVLRWLTDRRKSLICGGCGEQSLNHEANSPAPIIKSINVHKPFTNTTPASKLNRLCSKEVLKQNRRMF